MRLILENSTVCHSRRISLLCPVFCFGFDLARAPFLGVGGGVGWLDGFFGKAMILAIMLDVCFLPGVGSFFRGLCLLGVGCGVVFQRRV